MNHHPRYQHTPEELFLTVFVYIDDYLKPIADQLPNQPAQKASVSEILTIAIVGEMLAQPFESTWYWLVQHTYRALFPSLPSYTRYHRILRQAEQLIARLALSVPRDTRLRIVDSLPLPVAKGKRASWSRFPEASKGFSTMGMVFGFKLHAVIGIDGLFDRWAFAPANLTDVTLAADVTEGLDGQGIVGDKAYIGSGVVTPKRSNMSGEDVWDKGLDRVRKRIESSFSSLVRSLTLHAARVKTFVSLRTRVNLKIAAFNLLHSGVLSR